MPERYHSARYSAAKFCIGIASIALAAALSGCADPPAKPAEQRLVVLGFDGMDPVLAERWMAEGRLPNFSALADSGYYQRLATSNPPQSPVAWASFATGHNPGAHGIFDFLARDPETYHPDFSIAKVVAPETMELFGWQVPTSEGSVENRRRGVPFWVAAEQAGRRASVLRVPVTFPPDPITRMLSGMGVPDLLGSQGTYTIYATRRISGAENGGRVKLVTIADDGVIRTTFEGPQHPLDPAAGALTLDLEMRRAAAGIAVRLADAEIELAVGRWSDWIPLSFEFAGVASVEGQVRLYALEGFPRPRLYISPIHIDPLAPALALSSPAEYATQLAERIGRYHSIGMPEETWSLNQGHMDEQGWLEMTKTTLAEGEAMLRDTLARNDSELVIKVFVQTDRVSHMFWHGLDATHPMHAQASELARGAIPWIYREADRILGETRAKLGPRDRLVVLSDHGFAAFRRAVHLNRWLLDHGYLTLLDGQSESPPLFAAVDWTRTRAYALGLNGLFLNRKGREAQGIVEDADVTALKAELIAGLRSQLDPVDATRMFLDVYDGALLYQGSETAGAPDLVAGYAPGYRASWQTSLGAVPPTLLDDNRQHWSGDHCIDPTAVPGVLFASFRPATPVGGIEDLAQLLLDSKTSGGPP